jgi:hypothetical protein
MSIAAVLTVVVALIIGFDVPARIGRALRLDTEIASTH